jgi:hypothetical protein
LAPQFISQLEDEVRDAVLGNCGTVISLRVGPNDAPIIGRTSIGTSTTRNSLDEAGARVRPLINGKPASVPIRGDEDGAGEWGYLAANIRNTAANYAPPTRTPRVPNEEGSENKAKKLVVMRALAGQL